jgi:hypothetical protein
MFNDPCKGAHPVVEGALNVLKSEAIHTTVIASSISSWEWNSPSFIMPLDRQKSQKSHGLTSGEYGGCDNRKIWCCSNFDATFDPLWRVELSMAIQKVNPGFRWRKFRFVPFTSGEMQSMKYSWLNLLPFGRRGMPQTATPKLRLATRGENGPCRTNHHSWASGARFWFATSDKRRRRV